MGPKQELAVVLALGPALRPIFKPLADLAFEPTIARLIKPLTRHAVWEVILSRECIVCFMVVLVSGAVTQVLHQPRRRVQDMRRRHQRTSGFGGRTRATVGRIYSIRFRRSAQVNYHLSDRQFSLG